MPPHALSLALAPRIFWEPLAPISKTSTVSWLSQINQHKIPVSNWQTFRLLVNTALKRLGVSYDPSAIEKALTHLESFYLGDGWYSDGLTQRRDYYVSLAVHFALLIYARLMEPYDPLRAATYRKRAVAFAQDFVYCFTAKGAPLPFGRCLTYRFAQGAFWGALAFADVEALPWGVIKGLYLRHLRHWFRLPIFTSDGLLSLGYA